MTVALSTPPISPPSALVAAAHDYLAAGLHVIALSGKLPNRRWHPHGFHDALSGVPERAEDDALIERIFDHDDTTGVGIVLDGRLCVVDIDGEEGAQQFGELVPTYWRKGGTTAVARTARGLHLYFLSPRIVRTTKLGPKLDLKGIGGYVAAPPSVHPGGAVYTWLDPLVYTADTPSGQRVCLDWLPDEVEEAVGNDSLDGVEFRRGTSRRCIMQAPSTRGEPSFEVITVTGDIDALAGAVERAEEGSRNNMLFWAAAEAAEGGFPIADVYETLLTAALRSGLDQEESRRTIVATYRRQARRGDKQH